jgi:deoxyribonuclease V
MASASATGARIAGRFGAVDVHYPATGGARAALVVAEDERFASIVEERVAWRPDAAPYTPGSFFTRELPALRGVLPAPVDVELLIVDGYVDLDPHGRPGLGAHVHAEFAVPVIGVAKSMFRTATHAVALHRGSATRPLYVTAIGIEQDRAVALVTGMSGQFRLPDALRRVDALARDRPR